jgi:5-methylcytosine-specific restriction endonuclease McrA
LKRAKSICSHPGCNVLLDAPGRCEKHQRIQIRSNFDYLDRKKSDEDIKFYSSAAWQKVSRAHREVEPLCRSCRDRGLVVAAQMVHHEPDRKELIKRGESPLDDRFLVSLCNNCHLVELRKKKTNNK